MVIETAKTQDIEDLVDLGEAFVAESPSLSLLDYSRNQYSKFCQDVITSKEKCMFIIKDKDQILGVIAGGLHPRIGSFDQYLSEYIYYVDQTIRKNGAGKKLMNRFCDWGKLNEAKAVEVGVTSDIDPKQADKYMTGLGFKYMGANFYKEL
tara:strand:+ start:1455 stop:1907 length:453 start_codon:yes stop_codon:yes gene_type:complete